MLYFQERIGIDGKTFKVIKFATMLEKSSKIGSRASLIRMTLGSFLLVVFFVEQKLMNFHN